MIPADLQLIRAVVRERVGGFFCNTYVPGTAGVCVVCRGPAAEQDLCNICQGHRATFGNQLADRTILLTYALGNYPDGPHQSAHVVRAYKGYKGTHPVRQCQQDLELMVSVAVGLHGGCLDNTPTGSWDSLTFVPSLERPGRSHPVTSLANAALAGDPIAVMAGRTPQGSLEKFLLEPGPGANVKRRMVPDRYRVPDMWRSAVAGKNVLIVDDTWTTGASAQGAAVAVKQAGASSATVLCVDRWLRCDWSDHQALINSLSGSYDALRCPMHGRMCLPGTGFTVITD
ncbi:phosphoribosyltransferase [Nocardia huaxiensis]|uniref:Phosphoribosyltransferase n=1 Tax=Nocardia huaxiensis TaxID=2755382 RepID=A0A7D6Z998_9NOCA|nr:phosphoribosyltransferase [Nocardia huaxiensis]